MKVKCEVRNCFLAIWSFTGNSERGFFGTQTVGKSLVMYLYVNVSQSEMVY